MVSEPSTHYEEEDKRYFDRILLAMVSRPREPATQDYWREKHGERGCSVRVVPDYGKEAEESRRDEHNQEPDESSKRLPVGRRSGDEDMVMVSAPYDHVLMSTPLDETHVRDFMPMEFKRALQERYDLQKGNFNLVTLRPVHNKSDQRGFKPAEAVLMVHAKDMKALARMALERLADPEIVESRLGMKRDAYTEALQNKDSALSKMIEHVVENGDFGRNDAQLEFIRTMATKLGNAAFARRLQVVSGAQPEQAQTNEHMRSLLDKVGQRDMRRQ